MEIQKLLSVSDMARETRESVAVWRKRLLGRQVPFLKLGRNVRVRREDLERWLEARLIPAHGEAKP